jgi:hypothetical protein
MSNKIFHIHATGIYLLGSILFGLVGPVLAADTSPVPPTSTVTQNPFGPKPTAQTAATSSSPTPANTPSATAPANDFVTTLRAMLLRRFDKNGDGKLDATELTEARKLISGGKDTRIITPAEAAAAAYGPLFGLRPLIMTYFDHNGDGQLNPAEMAEINTLLFGSTNTQPSPPADLAALQKEVINHFDKKGDGQLDATERAAAKAWLQQVIAELDKEEAAAAAMK